MGQKRSTVERFITVCAFAVLFVVHTASVSAEVRPYANDIACDGDYARHLQGVCTDERDSIFWSYTTELVKTDRLGKVRAKVPVDDHHGDLCFYEGKLYVAVNLGQFNNPEGQADSWVYVYEPADLSLIAKHAVPEVFHGAGGIDGDKGHFFVVGGLPKGVEENYVYEYDASFQFVKKHVVASGSTHLGIQTAAFHEDAWWFGCSGTPRVLLKTDRDFKLLGRYEFPAAFGIVGVDQDRFLVAQGSRTENDRHMASLYRAHPDEKHGLRRLPSVVSARDTRQVERSAGWQTGQFRFAADSHLTTRVDGATLDFEFEGTGVALRLAGHDTPAYGPPNLGAIAVTVDDSPPQMISPRTSPLEVVLAEGLPKGPHRVRVTHQQQDGLAGCRIESFQSWSGARGALRVHVSGEEDPFLVDCRAILRQGDTIVRNTLLRNWLSGECSLTGLAPGEGYTLEILATGWNPVQTEAFAIADGAPLELAPIYLTRATDTVIQRFRFPRLNQVATRTPGETFRARFLGFDATIAGVRLVRQVGPATISRTVTFEEDKTAAYYYDREVTVALPADMPPGLYDLEVTLGDDTRGGLCRSPRSVQVLAAYPVDPVFFSFGHLDTSGQYQAEYLARLAALANLLAPDAVLSSNAANPAYFSGALSTLDMPYVVNFGNHQVPGHEAWYGDPVSEMDLGPNVRILNVGLPWFAAGDSAKALLASRPKALLQVINAFEPNAPVELLNDYNVAMIHDGHGPGHRVAKVGDTPTWRIGKVNSESFRIIRFREGAVESCTYKGDPIAPIPFPRNGPTPIRVEYDQPNDGTATQNTARVTNDLVEGYPNARLRFVMPAGDYTVTGARLASDLLSDDGRFQVITVRFDIPASGSTELSLEPRL